MAVYRFSFPAAAAGKGVSIKNAAGDEVGTATAGSAAGVQGPVVVTADLPVGSYVAEATDAKIFFTSRAPGVLDVGSSIPTGFADLVGEVEGADGETLQEILDGLLARIVALEPEE